MSMFCNALIITGVFFLVFSILSYIKLKVFRIAYISSLVGFSFIISALLLKIITFC